MPLTVLPGAELGSSSEVALRLSTVADADGNAIAATVVAAGVSVADCLTNLDCEDGDPCTTDARGLLAGCTNDFNDDPRRSPAGTR